ncbi:helix-turn-helix domain-containing protein [Sinorhizobium meliloti]|uniref:helix-turn-helix domain-containing protein n=1 Tax=Rhizobium meliloti TaxID=382 RepID=UPI0001E4AB5A|nr:helix-turn-helix domain-containing protein [Sinorhizobium meliloti]AEG53143.1 hypothetical protein Sinme_1396 [Sinorhizobium meliloti AK83]MDE4591142.1 helix-turn-helix domain-containing protein [Sinorhizobium meliloti]SEI56012.1 hypothetical protein SAMN04244575_01044 [Sinorhizobium meliloti]
MPDLLLLIRNRPDGPQYRILSALMAAHPNGLTVEDLRQVAYPDGEPPEAVNYIRKTIVNLRRALARARWTIPSAQGDRSKLGHYRLAKTGTII